MKMKHQEGEDMWQPENKKQFAIAEKNKKTFESFQA